MTDCVGLEVSSVGAIGGMVTGWLTGAIVVTDGVGLEVSSVGAIGGMVTGGCSGAIGSKVVGAMDGPVDWGIDVGRLVTGGNVEDASEEGSVVLSPTVGLLEG